MANATPPTPTLGVRCASYGSYSGSGDVTLWRHGLAFVSSGLYARNQSGAILVADTRGPTPTVQAAPMFGEPEGFRPHGIFLHNATNRLFVISHNELCERESAWCTIWRALNAWYTYRFSAPGPCFVCLWSVYKNMSRSGARAAERTTLCERGMPQHQRC